MIQNRIDAVAKVWTLLFGLGAAGAALADDGRQNDEPSDDLPSEVTLNQFSYAGTGCPAGTLRGEMPTDGRAFLIFWDAFAAEAGPDVPLSQTRKNCQINLDLGYPQGWQYAVESLDYNGRLELGSGVQATVGSAYYFQGRSETARILTDFVGPESRDYHVVANYDLDGDGEGLVWSPCDAQRSLNVNVQVRVDPSTARDSRGLISLGDSQETAGSLLVLKWRRCD